MTMADVGTVLGTNQLVSQLGTNGVASSWRALDTANNVDTCVVTILQSEIVDRAAWEHFKACAAPLLNMPQSRLANMRGFGEDAGVYWCAFEWMNGNQLFRKAQAEGLPYSYIAIDWMAQTIEALDTLLRYGQSHRFLSPASIFITDLGHVRVLHAAWGGLLQYTPGGVSNQAFMSVLPFLAPEVVNGSPGDVAGDVYSVGATLYYLITGQPPHWAEDSLSLCDKIASGTPDFSLLAQYLPQEGVDLIQEMMASNPEDRPVNLPALQSRLSDLSGQLVAVYQAEQNPVDYSADIHTGNQNYTSRGAAYEGLGQTDEPIDELPPKASAVRSDRGTAPPTGDTPKEDSRSAIGRAVAAQMQSNEASAAAARSWAPPEPLRQSLSQTAVNVSKVESPGDAAAKKRLLIMVLAGLVVLGGIAFGVVSLFAPKKEDPNKPPVVSDAEMAAALKAAEQEVSEYLDTLGRLKTLGGYNAKYRDRFGRYARTNAELREVGALSTDLTDRWGRELDVREEFVISAGKDGKWDTNDDIYFSSADKTSGGYQPQIKIPTNNKLFGPKYEQLQKKLNDELRASGALKDHNVDPATRRGTNTAPANAKQPEPAAENGTAPPAVDPDSSAFGGRESEEKKP